MTERPLRPAFREASRMRYEDAVHVLTGIAAADSTAYWVVGALTLLVFLVMWTMLPLKSLAMLFAPAMFWSGLTGLYTATWMGFAVSPDKAANIAGTSALGMMVGLVVMTLITHAVIGATRISARTIVVPAVPTIRATRRV
ncbi:MAG: hypothetical protein AB7S70_03065 [Hyphomicrobium sp.]|uniref:hypothetical protein n=1 Tax=Hyphomicrobium sp. TaxID=82 RepID=UPI003D0EAB18